MMSSIIYKKNEKYFKMPIKALCGFPFAIHHERLRVPVFLFEKRVL